MNGSGPGLFAAVIESWRLVIGNSAALARAALFPFLYFVVLHRLESLFKPEGMAAILGWILLFTILAAPAAVILLMPWLRRLLAAADPAMAARPATWWSIVLMLRWVGLDVLFFAAQMPVFALLIQAGPPGPEPGSEYGAIAILYYATFIIGAYLFYGRMGLALPAAAAESDHRYRVSWIMTQNCGWRIGLAILLCYMSIWWPVGGLRSLLPTDDPTLAVQYADAMLDALLRVVNELLSAAVFVQFYLARTADPSTDAG